jgi:pSer/pThr/pTyr-binding forkhead associated (FHA) protein
MSRLRVTTGPAAGQTVDVEGELVIGREQAGLTIADPEMSRRHALVRPFEHGLSVEDLGSTNGTFVNENQIVSAVALATGDTIRLGSTQIEVEVELERSAQTQAGASSPIKAPPEPSPEPSRPRRGTVRRVTDKDPWGSGGQGDPGGPGTGR